MDSSNVCCDLQGKLSTALLSRQVGDRNKIFFDNVDIRRWGCGGGNVGGRLALPQSVHDSSCRWNGLLWAYRDLETKCLLICGESTQALLNLAKSSFPTFIVWFPCCR